MEKCRELMQKLMATEAARFLQAAHSSDGSQLSFLKDSRLRVRQHETASFPIPEMFQAENPATPCGGRLAGPRSTQGTQSLKGH